MEISNSCPYCGGEMREGALPMVRGTYRWYPRDEKGRLENEWGSDRGVWLGKAGLLGGELNAYHCENCGVVIVPVPEIETIGDKIEKVGEKLEDFLDRQKKAREEREREGEQRRREERRKRDPWER